MMKKVKRRLSLTFQKREHSIDESLSELAEQITFDDVFAWSDHRHLPAHSRRFHHSQPRLHMLGIPPMATFQCHDNHISDDDDQSPGSVELFHHFGANVLEQNGESFTFVVLYSRSWRLFNLYLLLLYLPLWRLFNLYLLLLYLTRRSLVIGLRSVDN